MTAASHPAHSPGLRQSAVHEQVDGLVGTEGQALAQDPHELSDGHFKRHQELVLVQVNQVGLGCSLNDDRNAVRVLLQDLPGLLLALFCSRVDRASASWSKGGGTSSTCVE